MVSKSKTLNVKQLTLDISFSVETGTPLLAKLKVGPFLKVIVENMYNTINASEKDEIPLEVPETPLKVSMFSGHDITVGNILNAMDMFDGNCPVFTATILIELMYGKCIFIHFCIGNRK